MEYIRNQLAAVGNLSDSKEINALRNDIAKMANTYASPNTAQGWHSRPQTHVNYPTNSASMQPSIPMTKNMGFLSPGDLDDQVLINASNDKFSNPLLNQLIDERDQLLMNGYDANDPLTME